MCFVFFSPRARAQSHVGGERRLGSWDPGTSLTDIGMGRDREHPCRMPWEGGGGDHEHPYLARGCFSVQ